MDHLPPDERAALQPLVQALPGRAGAAARSRWAAGTYGLCTACGEEIPAERLRDRPEVGLCEACGDALAADRAGRRFGVCGVDPER